MDSQAGAVLPCERAESTTRVFVLGNPDFYLEGLLAVLSRSLNSEVVACVKPGDGCWDTFLTRPADVLLIHRQAVLGRTRWPVAFFTACAQPQNHRVRP